MGSSSNEAKEEAVVLVVRLAKALHTYGTPAHRLEEALSRMSAQFDLEGQFFSTPTSIFAAFGPTGKQQMVLERVEPGEVHLGKLAALDDLLDDLARGEVEIVGARQRLQEIEASHAGAGTVLLVLSQLLVSAAGAFFFRGSTLDIGVSAVTGIVVGLLLAVLGRVHATRRLIDLLSASLAAFIATAVGTQLPAVHPYIVTLATLLILLPGLSLTTATSELASKHFVAGGSRFAGTVVVLVTLGFGAALGSQLATKWFGQGPTTELAMLSWYLTLPALLASSLGLAIYFRAEKRDFAWILASSAVTYGAVQFGARALGGVELGALFGAFVLGVFGSFVARVFRRPAAVATVPGLVLLVPGSVGFQSVASLVEHDTVSGIQTAFSMLVVAVAIVTGLLVASAVFPSRRAL
ncbi:MAG: threonine/serine exporter family protein [Candidatus Eisenbacteria bacterium]